MGSGARAGPSGVPTTLAAERHKSVQVKNPLVWDQHSFRIQRTGASKAIWELSGDFSAEVACGFAVYFHCREKLGEHSKALEYTPADDAAPPLISLSFPPGKHTFKLEGSSAIDLKRWPLQVFWKIRREARDVIPIVVSLRAGEVQSVVHLTLQVPPRDERDDGRELTVQMLRQKVCVEGKEYVLQEVYGIADMGHEADAESTAGEPCVICLTDPRNTAVLPCRHLCVCEECAKQLQVGAATRNDHCPICRGNITGMQVFEVQN